MRHLVFLLIAASICCARAAEPELAIINAVVSSSEDGPPVASDYRFSPGDYLYFTFEIAGFAVHTENQGEVRKISLSYTVVPMDAQGRPLSEAVPGDIVTTLNPEDKNWVPKRRASFLLPAFVAAGSFHVHVTAKDAFGKTESVFGGDVDMKRTGGDEGRQQKRSPAFGNPVLIFRVEGGDDVTRNRLGERPALSVHGHDRIAQRDFANFALIFGMHGEARDLERKVEIVAGREAVIGRNRRPVFGG